MRVEGGVEFESIIRERLQEKEGKRDWNGSWAIDRKERRPGFRKSKRAQRVGKKLEVVEYLFH